jgi:ankyrin repeat protein
MAVRTKNQPMVSFLLENGAHIDHVNHAGETALLIACYDTNRTLTNLLVQHGADVLITSKEGLSPIWYACAKNQKEIVALFLDNGVSVDFSQPVSGSTDSMNSYLSWVETASNISMEAGFNFHHSYSYGGESMLHVAAKNGHLSMVKLLLERGGNIDIQDESGNTALHYATSAGRKDVVKYLLEHGADVSVVNAKEQKAIDYASIKGFNEIATLLLGTATKPQQTAVPDVRKALLDLKELLDAGVLTEAEFAAQKAKLLAL